VRYGNSFTDDAMPDPQAQLIIDDYQQNVRRLTLVFSAPNPANPEELALFLHADRLPPRDVQLRRGTTHPAVRALPRK
jgi:hypothetical protein